MSVDRSTTHELSSTAGSRRSAADKKSGSILRSVAAAARLMWHVDKHYFAASAAIMAISGGIPVVMVHLSASLLGKLVDLIKAPNPLSELPVDLLLLIFLVGITAALAAGLVRASEAIQELYQRKLTNYSSIMLAAKSASIDISNFDDPNFHNLLQNASSEATSRPYQIVQSLMQAIAASTTLVSTALVIGKWHLWLLPVALIGPALAFTYNSHLAKRRVALVTTNTENERFERYLASALMSERSAKEIRLLRAGQYLLEQLRHRTKATYKKYHQFATRRLVGRICILAVTSLDKPLFFIYLAQEAVSHRISFPLFVLYAQAIPLFQGGINSIGQSITRLTEGSLFIQKLHEFMSLQPSVEAEKLFFPLPRSDSRHSIEFQNLCFQYAPGSEKILVDVSFRIEPGEFVALVGGNGSGKSTIVKLLGGLYHPTGGQILYRGADVAKLPRNYLREEIAIMLQDFLVFNMSASENIGLGDLRKINDLDAVAKAAETSGIASLINKWPDKFSTPLGRSFAGGKELSGGQRQQIALSRVAIADSSVVVFDEPTSALDAKNEDRFGMLLAQLKSKGTSVLCATHRLSVTQRADKIIVLEKGKIIAAGLHADLVTDCPQYAAIVHAHYNQSERDSVGGTRRFSG